MPTPPDTIEAAAPVATAEAPEQHVPLLIQQLYKAGITDGKPADDPEVKPDPGAKKPEAKPGEKPDPAKPAAEAKPGDDPPLRMRTEKPIRPTFKFEEGPQLEKKAAPVEVAKPDPKWEAGLDATEKEMLSSAREIEKLFPNHERFRGIVAKTEGFLRAHTQYVKDQGADFDADSPEYKAWLEKNQPALTGEEQRLVQTERVKQEVNRDWEGKHADLQHKLFVRDEEPKVEREGAQVFADLTNTALPEEVKKHLEEMIAKHGPDKGIAEAKKTYGLEIDVATAVLSAATDDIKEFLRLNRIDQETGRPLARVADKPTDKNYEQHKRLGQVLESICADFKKTAPLDQQVRDGRWFVTRDEYNRLVPADRAKAWSFSNAEIIQRMKSIAKNTLGEAIKQRIAYMEGTGFRRTPPVVVKEDLRKPEETRRAPGPAPAPAGGDAPPGTDPMVTQLMGALNREP